MARHRVSQLSVCVVATSSTARCRTPCRECYRVSTGPMRRPVRSVVASGSIALQAVESMRVFAEDLLACDLGLVWFERLRQYFGERFPPPLGRDVIELWRAGRVRRVQ